MAAKTLHFSDTQQQVIDARKTNLLVSASAGAGKTAVLVERLCQLVLKDRIPIHDILAMTFTEDAAAEMKTRLRERLKQEGSTDPWIQAQISELETASISTIHSFCLDIVQHYYYLAGLDYSMVQHVDNGAADEQALANALRLAAGDLDPEAMAALQVYMEAFGCKDPRQLRQLVLKFLETARARPDAQAWMDDCRANCSQALAPWYFAWFSMRIAALLDIFEHMRTVVEEMEFAKQKSQEEYTALFSRKIDALQNCLEALNAQDYNAFGHAFVEYIETTGKFTPTINKQKFTTEQKDSREIEKQIADRLFSLQELSAASRQILPVQSAFVDLAQATQRHFARLKAEGGFIDFSDMEQFAWRILQNPIAAQELKKRYQIILVDEYQDTNDLQEAILSSIARTNNVFRVGDVKQSIYGFRQARPALMKAHMASAGENDQVIAMQENYRSSARLIRFFNTFFSELMNAPGLPPQFSAIDQARPGTQAQSEGDQPPVRFLYTVYGESEDGEKVNAAEAKRIHTRNRYDLIAADIEKKVQAGEVDWRDVAVLSRTSTPHEDIKQALAAWGIPSLHHMKKGFYTNKAVQIILSALRVIQDPRNDVALMAALCSPLTGLKQADLMPAAAGRQEGESLYQCLMSSSHAGTLLELVRDIRAWKNEPVPEIIRRLYMYRSFYDEATSAQDKTNLDLLLQKAVEANAPDLDAFLESANLEEDLDKTSEAMPFAREENAVRISTIHASKGLQYKLVYLLSDQQNRDFDGKLPIAIDPDLGLSLAGLDLNSHLKMKTAPQTAFEHKRFLEDLQEKMRLLYVACTRAEHELVFVDTLKTEEEYSGPLDVHALLANHGFTSWFFHVFRNLPGADVVFERAGLLENPGKSVHTHNKIHRRQYHGPVKTITSQTASASKQIHEWPRAPMQGKSSSLAARSRGTLMHEITAGISYPYTREAIEAFAAKTGQHLEDEFVQQILALNENAQYAAWMGQKHQFECPYLVMLDGAVVHGFMDLAVFGQNTVDIIDFKSDRVMDEQMLVKRYSPQLNTYRKAMAQIEPDKQIRTWIYSFHLNELIALEA